MFGDISTCSSCVIFFAVVESVNAIIVVDFVLRVNWGGWRGGHCRVREGDREGAVLC